MKGFQKRIGSQPAIRNVLHVCGLLVALAAPAIISNAYRNGGGQGSAAVEEKAVEEQIITTSVFSLSRVSPSSK
jgi:hypothetical protein